MILWWFEPHHLQGEVMGLYCVMDIRDCVLGVGVVTVMLY